MSLPGRRTQAGESLFGDPARTDPLNDRSSYGLWGGDCPCSPLPLPPPASSAPPPRTPRPPRGRRRRAIRTRTSPGRNRLSRTPFWQGFRRSLATPLSRPFCASEPLHAAPTRRERRTPPLVAPRRPRGTSSGAAIFAFGALRGPMRAGGGRERHRRARLPWGDVVAEFGRRRRRPRVDVRAHPSCGGGAAGGSAGATRQRPRGPLLRPAAGSSSHVDGRRELLGTAHDHGGAAQHGRGARERDRRSQVRVPHQVVLGAVLYGFSV